MCSCIRRFGFVILSGLQFPLSFFNPVLAEELNFQHYGVRQGLPQTQVLAIHQDATGYLWVGTYGGLGRYNGRDFVIFGNEHGLSSNTIGAITHDGYGRLWVGTTNGLCYLPPDADRFECLNNPALTAANVQVLGVVQDTLWVGTSDGLHSLLLTGALSDTRNVLKGNVTSLTRTTDGALLVGTREGLLRVAGTGGIEAISVAGRDDAQITALLRDDARAWVGTDAGLFVMNDGERHATRVAEVENDFLVNALARGHDGVLWVATSTGVLQLDDGVARWLTTFNGLMANINFDVFVDREGLVWLGNDDGLTKYVPGAFVGYSEKHGLLHYFVRTINEDDRQRLWLGTREGVQIVPYVDGAWRFDRSETITARDGLVDVRVYSIAFPAPGEALLATGGGVAHWRAGEGVLRTFTRDDGLPVNATQALKIDDGKVWIGTNLGVVVLEGGRIRPAPDPALAVAYVYRIQEDTQGRLWFGSQDHGLFMLGSDGQVARFGKAQGLSDETVWDLVPDANGGIWVGTNGDGLFHVAADGGITRYTTSDGLVDNFIWQVLVDAQGRVWTYTNRGISQFDGTRFHNYGAEDGLLHLEGGATGAWQTHDGQLWFASADGLMRNNPVRTYSNDRPPPVVLEDVMLAGIRITAGAELPYQAGSLEIQYAALSFQSEPQLRYQYRLRGAGEEWSEPVPYRPITYANLGAGRYEFEVRAQNPDGVWSEEPARIAFRILPPFWATAWFWALALLSLVLLVWTLFRVRVRQIEARRRELEDIVATRTRELEVVNQKLRTASVTDPLTGLHNRRFLSGQIRTDVAQSRRAYRRPSVFPNRDIIFMMIDLDHFKEINDTYGHDAGDRVLRQYAKLLGAQIRESDYVVRWGGEEFLVVARQAEATQCNVIAERLIHEVRAANFVVDDEGTTLQCTCSIGVSYFPFLRKFPDTLTWEQIICIADIAVYMAKALGRDGWVSIQGTDKMETETGENLMRAMREDMARLVDTGRLVISGSYDNIEDAAIASWQDRRGD